jgi:hypothetical protein
MAGCYFSRQDAKAQIFLSCNFVTSDLSVVNFKSDLVTKTAKAVTTNPYFYLGLTSSQVVTENRDFAVA